MRRAIALISGMIVLPGFGLAQEVARYVGVTPCGDCAGIERTLTLAQTSETAGTYRLISVYQGKPDGRQSEGGTFLWDAERREAHLAGANPQTSVQISDRGALLMTAEGTSSDAYLLRPADGFFTQAAQLFVTPESLIDARMDASGQSHVVFQGVANFEAPRADGARSLIGRFDLDCSEGTVAWAATKGYARTDGDGAEVPRLAGADLLPMTFAASDVFGQAAARYCAE